MKTPKTIVITNGVQTRTLGWSDFCFNFVGSKNADTIKRIATELEEQKSSYFIAPVDGVGIAIEMEN